MTGALAERRAYGAARRGELPDPGQIARDLVFIAVGVTGPDPSGLAVETATAAARRGAERAAEAAGRAAALELSCRKCGAPVVAGPAPRPHYARLECARCGLHHGWLSKPRRADRRGA